MDDDTRDSFRPPHGLGRRPDTPDRRDRIMYRAIPNVDALPDTAMHLKTEATLPPPMDQGSTGSCTGFSGAAMFRSAMVRDGHRRPFVPSPVFLYGEARRLGGYYEEDAGAEIRNILKASNRLGLPPMSNLKPRFKESDLANESTYLWPKDSIWIKPPTPSLLADAERRQAIEYKAVPTLPDILQALAEGRAVVFGFMMYRSFFDAYGKAQKIISMPEKRDWQLGGHAVVAYDYDKPNRVVWCRNSWGEQAHYGGANFALPFPYMEQYASDGWVASFIEGGKPV